MKKKSKRAAAKRKTQGGRSSAMRELVGSDSPAAVLAAIDKFVANRKANCDRLSARVERAKRLTPAQRKELAAHFARRRRWGHA